MNFQQCLRSAIDQKAITSDEAEELLRRFEELRGQYGLDFDDATARVKARDDLVQELRAEGIEVRRRAKLQGEAVKAAERDLLNYRNAKGEADVLEAALRKLEHFGFAGYSSVEGRAKAIIALAHGQMNDMLMTFQRNIITGKRKEMPRLERVRDEMLGTATGDATAREFAEITQSVFEALRQRFNAAGGAIGKLEGGYLPQAHDAAAMLKAGRARWKETITPLLDPGRMKDHVTGLPMTPAKLAHLLDSVFDRITTEGWIDRKPQSAFQGRGMIASQRAEHRVLHFKDAAAWQAYADAFGQGDPFTVIMTHIRGMAHDIAAMEVLGPNAEATIEFMKQLVKAEQAKAIAGKPSAFNANTAMDIIGRIGDTVNERAFNKSDGSYAIDSLWSIVRGGDVGSNVWAKRLGSVRNLLTSAQLGAAILAAVLTDPFLATYAKKLAGLPARNVISEFLSTFTGASRAEAVHAGLILDDAMHIMGREARYAGALAGGNGTRWLADRTITLSGLASWTQARKHVFGLDWMTHTADEIAAGKGWDALDQRFRQAMEGFGIGPAEWAVMAKADRHQVPGGKALLRPAEIANLDRTIAERYAEMIHAFTERAVPSGTKRGRALLTGGALPGTVLGELANGMMQYKSFGLSVLMLQSEAVAREAGMGGRAAGARYAGGLLLGLTLGGAVAMQLRHLANGKDPQPMDDARFWLAAAKTGGGLGIFGDFLFAEHGRFGHHWAVDLMGPQAGLVADVGDLVLGNARKASEGEETNLTDKSLRFARRYTPVVSSLAYTRAAWNRTALDQLQYLIDPQAHQAFRDQRRRLDREFNQGFYWQPGQASPGRLPDFNPDRLFAR